MRQPDSWIEQLPHGAKVTPGTAGDHPLIQQLLLETLQTHLEEDFQSRLDDPAYRPSDRLLVRIDDLLTAHVHIVSHVGMFNGERMPLVWLENFVTLPEYESKEHSDALLRASEAIATQEGALIGLTVTDRPAWFESRGWTRLVSQGHTRANVRAMLAHFDAQQAMPRKRRSRGLKVRAWRHVELDALRTLYDQATCNGWGALCRSEQRWQWLMGRKAHDQISLAIDSRESDDQQQADQSVVGYAVVRDSCVIEMFTLPGYLTARMNLLATACRDAIDRDHHFISLHTAADDTLHDLMVTAGGSWVADGVRGGERWMVKLFSPQRWIERLYPLLHQRAKEADVPRPFTVEMSADSDAYELTLTRRSARLEPVATAKNPLLRFTWGDFQDLLLGNYVGSAVAETSNNVDPATLQPLSSLLPPRLLWQSPFEFIRL